MQIGLVTVDSGFNKWVYYILKQSQMGLYIFLLLINAIISKLYFVFTKVTFIWYKALFRDLKHLKDKKKICSNALHKVVIHFLNTKDILAFLCPQRTL